MIARLLLLTFAGLLTVTLFRTLFLFHPPPETRSCKDSPIHKRIKLDEESLERFKSALNIPTVSYNVGDYNVTSLLKLIDYLEKSFPMIHASNFVTRERISNFSLVYTVSGSNSKLRPYMLTAHLDVVPAVNEAWSSDPFEAVVKDDGYLYARGTIDDKNNLISMLEAFENMIKQGFKPNRSFFLVFGHDEEITGLEGARRIKDILLKRIKERNWNQLEYILDEGNVISKTRFPGIQSDIALVGVVEKGYATVKLSTVGEVGHGSMPPSQTAISKLSKALANFNSHIFPSHLGSGVEREMIEIFAAHAKWPFKMVYANFWLFQPIFQYIFSSDPTLNALIRTSTAVTMIRGGTKENVLPDSAEAYINHRIHPSQNINDVLKFDTEMIADPTVQIEIKGVATNPTAISDYCDNCNSYQLLSQTIREIFPNTIVVPCTFLAASDSRWYTELTKSIYKFSPIAVQLDEMKRFHGHDERISLENYESMINFYHHLITNSDKEILFKPPVKHAEL